MKLGASMGKVMLNGMRWQRYARPRGLVKLTAHRLCESAGHDGPYEATLPLEQGYRIEQVSTLLQGVARR